MHRAVGLLLCVASSASAFVGAPAGLGMPLRGRTSASGVASLRCGVQVEKDVDAVGVALCGYVSEAAEKAIKERGHFGARMKMTSCNCMQKLVVLMTCLFIVGVACVSLPCLSD